MALPIANLGYMPNMNAPSGGGTRVVGPSAWEQLAMQVAAGVLTQGVGNAMSKDYTQQAQAEGLAVDPKAEQATFLKKLLQGPTTDQKQLSQLRGEKATADQVKIRETGDDSRAKLAKQTQYDIALANQANAKDIAGMKLTSEERRALAKLSSDQAIAEGRNTTALTVTDKKEAGDTARNTATNINKTTNAGIMAGSAVNQAKVLEAIQKLLMQGKTSTILNPNDPNAATGGVDPAVMEAIQKLLAGQQGVTPTAP